MMERPIAAFIRKEFFHIWRDRRTMLILLVMPIVLIFLLGFAMSTDIRNVNVAYMDSSDQPVVRRIMERIDQSEYFTVVKRVYTVDMIAEMIKAGKIDAALRFNNDNGMQIIVDASNPNIGSSQAMYLQSIVMSELREQNHIDTPNGASPTIRMLYNPRMQSAYNFVPGILGLVLILICAMMTSISIVREKETGTMEVLLTAPLKPINIVIAKMVPYFVISCVNIATILLLARFVLHVPLSGSLWLIVLFAMVYTLMALSLGLLVSTLTNNQTTALIISAILLMIPVMMLSGMIFPIDSMPGFFRVFSNVVPARWFIDAMRKLMIEGLSFRYVSTDLWILSGMTAVFISVSLLNFKSRLE